MVLGVSLLLGLSSYVLVPPAWLSGPDRLFLILSLAMAPHKCIMALAIILTDKTGCISHYSTAFNIF